MSSSKEIENLLDVSMEKIKSIVSVNTVIGDLVKVSENVYIIPLSKMVCGFVAGGGEYGAGLKKNPEAELAFGGGSGAGLTVQPVGFLVVNSETGHIQFMNIGMQDPVGKIIDMTPEILNKIENLVNRRKKKEVIFEEKRADNDEPEEERFTTAGDEDDATCEHPVRPLDELDDRQENR